MGQLVFPLVLFGQNGMIGSHTRLVKKDMIDIK